MEPHPIQLTSSPARSAPLPGLSGTSRVNDDFTFELKMQPGQQVIRANASLQGATLKAVRLNGTDVTDAGIDVRAGEAISGV